MVRAQKTLIVIIFAFGLFFSAFLMQGKVRKARPDLKTGLGSGQETLPPSFQLPSTLLGGFRCFLVDFLWIRAEKLQREGRYFVASELARWITALQSRVEGGWIFQAWNLGFNVPSVLPPEERWPYVKSALQLLAEDALRANPGSLDIHYEIARLWRFKVGSEIDPAGGIYRKRVRELVERILGPPKRDIGKFVRDLELLSLLREEKRVQDFLRRLRLRLEGIEEIEKNWVRIFSEPEKYLGGRGRQLRRELKTGPLLSAYDRALRAVSFKDTFGLELEVVERTLKRYGNLDIAAPESFAVFWTQRGLEKLEPGSVRLDAIALWRLRLAVLRRLFRKGNLFLAGKIDRDYRRISELVGQDPYHRKQKKLFEKARVEFLRRAVPILFLSGPLKWRRDARELFAGLRGVDPEGIRTESLENYTLNWLFDTISVENTTRREILFVTRALLRRSFGALERGEEEGAEQLLLYAKRVYEELLTGNFPPELVPDFDTLLKEERQKVISGRGSSKGAASGVSG